MAQQAKPNIYSHIDFPDYVFVEFPKALYKASGSGVATKTVNNADEEVAAGLDGWTTLVSGVAPPVPTADPPPAKSKA